MGGQQGPCGQGQRGSAQCAPEAPCPRGGVRRHADGALQASAAQGDAGALDGPTWQGPDERGAHRLQVLPGQPARVDRRHLLLPPTARTRAYVGMLEMYNLTEKDLKLLKVNHNAVDMRTTCSVSGSHATRP